MIPQGKGQWNKYPRKPYPERGHDGQTLNQEIVDTTNQDMGLGTDIFGMNWLN